MFPQQGRDIANSCIIFIIGGSAILRFDMGRLGMMHIGKEDTKSIMFVANLSKNFHHSIIGNSTIGSTFQKGRLRNDEVGHDGITLFQNI
mmetsp:Transcript_112196/g.219995  ORF Transcript_112196/g.219995 Transcript_112196/m.219995 type:complete len:90 (+) Transcript_112196:209-478(+)